MDLFSRVQRLSANLVGNGHASWEVWQLSRSELPLRSGRRKPSPPSACRQWLEVEQGAPLPDGQVRDHLDGQASGHLRRAPRYALDSLKPAVDLGLLKQSGNGRVGR